MTKTLFQHLNAVYTNQQIDYWDDLGPADQKSYNVYMINRLISMNMDYVELVNEFQKLYESLTARESYLFYSQMLPRRKQWNKYVKAKQESKHEEWIVELVAHHFCVSKTEAKDYLDLYMSTVDGKDGLKRILEMYGTDPKKVKRATK